MKICVFSYVFYPESFLLNELVKELSDNHDVCVYTGLPNYPLGQFFEGYSLLKGPYKEKHLGAKVIRFPHAPRKIGKINLVINYLSFTLSSILNVFRLKKSDVILVFATSPILTMIPAIMHKWRSGCKVVVWLQDIWPEAVVAVGGASKNSLSYKIISKLVRWMYSGVDVMLVQSNKFDYNLDQHGFKGERIWIPNWAPEFESFDEMTLPEKKHFRVTFAGNIGRVQGLNALIEAAKALKSEPIEFVIVGDGSEKSALQKQSEGLENVTFLGRRPLSEMPSLFEQSDALFVGLKDDELLNMVIPSKLQAYLTAKKPIVAMLSGAGAELCQEMESGPVVTPGDSKALAQSLLQLSQQSEAERAEMGERAYKTYLKYFQKKEVVKKITNILQDAVKR